MAIFKMAESANSNLMLGKTIFKSTALVAILEIAEFKVRLEHILKMALFQNGGLKNCVSAHSK